MNNLIYILDDDKSILEIYTMCFSNLEVDLKCFSKASSFFECLNYKKPDLIILDIMLPETSGLEILEKLKKNNNYMDIPVILISAKNSEIEKVTGLDLGADDYIEKPFGLLELRSRVKASLRRIKKKNNKIEYLDLKIDLQKRLVYKSNKLIDLTQKEFDILFFLIDNKEKVLKREDIIKQVWGHDFLGESRTIDMHIKSLRSKLGTKEYIKTIRGIGYIISDEQ